MCGTTDMNNGAWIVDFVVQKTKISLFDVHKFNISHYSNKCSRGGVDGLNHDP